METSCGPGRRERRLLRLGLLVHADVVDEEPLRKDLVVDALLTAPAASDGEVEKEVLLLVERPGVGPASLVPEGEVLLAIDEEVDALPVPLDGVDVELLRRFGTEILSPLFVFWMWLYFRVCTFAWTTPGSKPTCSMMSISPQAGQRTSRMFVPRVQIAGQVPRPEGSFALTSMRP